VKFRLWSRWVRADPLWPCMAAVFSRRMCSVVTYLREHHGLVAWFLKSKQAESPNQSENRDRNFSCRRRMINPWHIFIKQSASIQLLDHLRAGSEGNDPNIFCVCVIVRNFGCYWKYGYLFLHAFPLAKIVTVTLSKITIFTCFMIGLDLPS